MPRPWKRRPVHPKTAIQARTRQRGERRLNWREFFRKSTKAKRAPRPLPSPTQKTGDVPEGIIEKCPQCGALLYTRELEQHLYVCPKCGHHFPMSAPERFRLTFDGGRFFEYDADLVSDDPLEFPGYREKLEQAMQKTGLTEAVMTGEGTIKGHPVVMAAMDGRFIMGSMGSVVGEKIARAIENARIKRYPLIIFAASGGARMQEGMLSLMQMAKTSAAVERFHRTGGLFISVLTHPTTGGVSASFAMLGDYLFAEPGALIGFAGRRIIEQTIRQELPPDFQTAEFLLRHGQLDRVVPRKEMRDVLGKVLAVHAGRGRSGGKAASV
ncbi:MAG: acetyl-CoA carboxylase carboxyltransferase subunit beta [Hydrogenibacillus sp.]|nr:acetyl-CoA carboxylase carboxyltransferase subunit beta [Hydrogenibacillus sp.]